MVLVDTSVWIETFRRDQPLVLDTLIDVDDIVTCAPVIQEILQGFDDEQGFRIAREAMLAFPCLEYPMDVRIHEQAADLYRRARRSGKTIRSAVTV